MKTESSSAVTAVGVESAALAEVILPAVLAIAFGAFLLFGTALAGSSTIHNAAHDGRHAFSFPCH